MGCWLLSETVQMLFNWNSETGKDWNCFSQKNFFAIIIPLKSPLLLYWMKLVTKYTATESSLRAELSDAAKECESIGAGGQASPLLLLPRLSASKYF